MDTTAFGILVGLTACILYALIRAVRQRSFDIGTTILCFLAGFSLPGGTALIAAGVRGVPSSLPSSWREYVAVAGIAAIGLGIHFLIQACRAVWPKPALPGAPNQIDSQGTEGRGILNSEKATIDQMDKS